MDGLETYLQKQHAAGRMASHGEFTVALEKARQKLRQFQLGNPNFYLLKVFQAAVASGCARVNLELKHNRVSLWFCVEDAPFSFPELLEGLSCVLGLAPSPLRDLAVGLNASRETNPERLALAWWGQGQSQALVVGDSERMPEWVRCGAVYAIPASLRGPDRIFLRATECCWTQSRCASTASGRRRSFPRQGWLSTCPSSMSRMTRLAAQR